MKRLLWLVLCACGGPVVWDGTYRGLITAAYSCSDGTQRTDIENVAWVVNQTASDALSVTGTSEVMGCAGFTLSTFKDSDSGTPRSVACAPYASNGYTQHNTLDSSGSLKRSGDDLVVSISLSVSLDNPDVSEGPTCTVPVTGRLSKSN